MAFIFLDVHSFLFDVHLFFIDAYSARSLAQRLHGGQLADNGITLGHLPGKAERMCFREMFVSSMKSMFFFILEGCECRGL